MILVILVYSFGVVTTQLVIEHCRDLAVEALQDANAIPECPEALSRYWASVGTSTAATTLGPGGPGAMVVMNI